MLAMLDVDPLFSFRNGDHTCVFYSDIESLLEVLTPYIVEGLLNNQRCFCAQTPEILSALANDLRVLGIDPEQEARRGKIELHTVNDVYFPERRFEPPALMDLLNQAIEDSVRSGFSGLRTAGDLGWAVNGRNECDRLIDYEKRVQAAFPTMPALGICQYPIGSFDREVLNRVIRAHSKVLDAIVPGAGASLHIRNATCEAEIIRDKRASGPTYRYVVELQSGDVFWGHSADFDSALRSVEDLLAVQPL